MTPVKSPWMEHPASQRNLLLSTGPTPLKHDTHVKLTIAQPPPWPCGGKSTEIHYGLARDGKGTDAAFIADRGLNLIIGS